MTFRIRNILIFSLLLVMLLPITLVSFFSYFQTKDLLISEMREATLQTIEDANQYYIARYVKDIEQALKLLSSDIDVSNIFDHPAKQKLFLEEWDSYRRFNENAYYVYIGTQKGQILVSPVDWQPPEDYDPRLRPWYKDALANREKTSWSRPYIEYISFRKVVTAVKVLEEDGEVMGVMGIDISLDSLSSLIKDLHLGQDAYAILLDERGHVIAHADSTMIGKNLNDQQWFQDIEKSEKGSLFYDFKDGTTFVSYASVPNTSWKLVGFIPKATLEENIAPIRNNAITLGVIFSLLAFGTSLLFSSTITNIIKGFIKAMDQVEAGNYTVSLDYPYTLEANRLAQKFNGMVGKLATVINELKDTEQELRTQKTFFKQLFENSPESIAILDENSNVLDVNHQFEQFFQYPLEELVGKNLDNFIVPTHLVEEGYSLTTKTLNKNSIESETIRQKKDGSLVEVLILGYPVMDNGDIVGVYGIYRDITTRKKSEKHLQYVSLHDSLTGVFNRAHFEAEMMLHRKNNSHNLGLILCDVDGLKLINDTLGHHQGDKLLIETTKVLIKAIPEKATLFRIGGDEFAILVPDSTPKELEKINEKVRMITSEYNDTHYAKIPLSLSLGFSFKNPLLSLDEVFEIADANMYKEKMQQSLTVRDTIVKSISQSLETKDFMGNGHGERLEILVEGLGLQIGLSKETLKKLKSFAKFHDIGKVGISDEILFKPGALSFEEKKEMQRHSEIGYRIAVSTPELISIADWILKHHEWWNGQGYPLGITGENIPIAVRILAIAEAYEVMTNERPYRKPLTHEEAIEELKSFSGIQFDPELVSIFIKYLDS